MADPVTQPPYNMTLAPPHFVNGLADVAKLVSALVLFCVVLFSTYVPAFCVRRARRPEEAMSGSQPYAPSARRHDVRRADEQRQQRRWAVAVSCFNCFSGGVFLSTGILDVLPDAQSDVAAGLKAYGAQVKFPLACFCLLVGFFVLLVIEQVVACNIGHSHAPPRDKRLGNAGQRAERRMLLEEDSEADSREEQGAGYRRRRRAASLTASLDGIRVPGAAPPDSRLSGRQRPRLQSDDVEAITEASEEEEEEDHLVSVMARDGSAIRSIFLVGAMSVHSLFEGLALGLETSAQLVYQLLGAISLHKTILSLGIGLSLGQTRQLRRCVVAVCSLIFAMMSPLGTVIGMTLTYVASMNTGNNGKDRKRFQLVSGILQGMACGTFLYVTFFEILPREINAATRPLQRTIYMISLLAGFLCMSMFIFFL